MSEDGPWTREAAAELIGDAAGEAAQGASGTREAVIEAVVRGAVDQARLVWPSAGIDPRWAEAIRPEVGAGVSPNGGADAGVVKQRVRKRTLEWIRTH